MADNFNTRLRRINLPPAGKHFHIADELALRAHLFVMRTIIDSMVENSTDDDADDGTYERTFRCSPEEWEAYEMAQQGADKALGPYTPDLYYIGKEDRNVEALEPGEG